MKNTPQKQCGFLIHSCSIFTMCNLAGRKINSREEEAISSNTAPSDGAPSLNFLESKALLLPHVVHEHHLSNLYRPLNSDLYPYIGY